MAGQTRRGGQCLPGTIGGFGVSHHLRRSFVFLKVFAMQQPEVYIGRAATFFDSAGNLINKDTRTRLKTLLEAYAKWIEIHLTH